MKRFHRRIRPMLALVLVVLAGLAPGWFRGVSEASGCSREENRRATSDACRPAIGQTCYYCEYSHSAGYSVCYENADGSVKFCTDFQTL